MADIYSDPSSVDTETVTSDAWWLKAPTDPDLNTRLRVADDAIAIQSTTPQGVFQPLGRANSIVVSDTPKGDTVTLNLSFMSKADYEAFHALRSAGATLLLQSPFERQWYVAVAGDVSSSLVYRKDTTEHRSVTVSFIETSGP